MLESNEMDVLKYCEDNKMLVSPSSVWKLQYLDVKPRLNNDAILNESLYKFDDISFIPQKKRSEEMKFVVRSDLRQKN